MYIGHNIQHNYTISKQYMLNHQLLASAEQRHLGIFTTNDFKWQSYKKLKDSQGAIIIMLMLIILIIFIETRLQDTINKIIK